MQDWRALMVRKRADRAREEAAKKLGESGGGGGSGGGPGSNDGKGGTDRSHGTGRRSKHTGRMSSRRKKYRRNEFQQMQQQEVRERGAFACALEWPQRWERSFLCVMMMSW